MDFHSIIAAGGNGSANFIVGILLGACLGYPRRARHPVVAVL